MAIADPPPSRALTPTVVILCGAVILFLSFGIRASFGLFLGPVATDLGWGREAFALALAVQNLLWGATQPLAGAAADRFGTARVVALGALLYTAGVLLMARTSTVSGFQLSAGLLVGLGLSGVSFSTVLAAMGRAVRPRHRSLVLGGGTAAASLGQFVLVPAGQGFITAYGWSGALLVLGALAVLMLPLAPALAGRASADPGQPDLALSEALGEALGHRGFRLLCLGFFVCGFHVAFIATHLPAYVADRGLAPDLGAWALALVGLFNIVGSLAAGMLGGRYSKKYLLSGLYFSRALLISLFVLVPATPATVLVFGAVMGLLWLGTVPLTSGLVAQIFGHRYLATLFGIVFFGHQLGSFLGIWLGGYFYDLTASYTVVWWIAVALGVASGLLHWPIEERPVARLADAP